jgi:hypothetical protein
MPRLILLWISNAISEVLKLCILWRVARTSTLRRYPFFSAYIASTLASIALPIVYLLDRSSYNRWYWPIQFVTLVLGCGIMLEIFQHVLSPYPGAERFAKMAAIGAFTAVFCLAVMYLLFGLEPASAAVGVELERNVRALQALLLFAVVVVIFRYAIPVGRNVLGMIIGYAGYIAISLVSRAIEAYAGGWLRLVWIYVQPAAFETSLLIWLVAMWSYYPNPAPAHSIQIETDYEALASRTRRALHATRSYIGRVARP